VYGEVLKYLKIMILYASFKVMFIPGKMILNVLILKKYLIFVHADFTLSGRNKPFI